MCNAAKSSPSPPCFEDWDSFLAPLLRAPSYCSIFRGSIPDLWNGAGCEAGAIGQWDRRPCFRNICDLWCGVLEGAQAADNVFRSANPDSAPSGLSHVALVFLIVLSVLASAMVLITLMYKIHQRKGYPARALGLIPITPGREKVQEHILGPARRLSETASEQEDAGLAFVQEMRRRSLSSQPEDPRRCSATFYEDFMAKRGRDRRCSRTRPIFSAYDDSVLAAPMVHLPPAVRLKLETIKRDSSLRENLLKLSTLREESKSKKALESPSLLSPKRPDMGGRFTWVELHLAELDNGLGDILPGDGNYVKVTTSMRTPSLASGLAPQPLESLSPSEHDPPHPQPSQSLVPWQCPIGDPLPGDPRAPAML